MDYDTRSDCVDLFKYLGISPDMLEILTPGIAGWAPKVRAFFELVDWTVQRGSMEFDFDHGKSKVNLNELA